ncbi:MAG: hypothetical protein R3B96_15315 [Pirellulaceae bacterium]
MRLPRLACPKVARWSECQVPRRWQDHDDIVEIESHRQSLHESRQGEVIVLMSGRDANQAVTARLARPSLLLGITPLTSTAFFLDPSLSGALVSSASSASTSVVSIEAMRPSMLGRGEPCGFDDA